MLDAGIAPSVGTVGDALEHALIESTIGLDKTELVEHDRRRSWTGRAEVEQETASWVYWFNTTRIQHSIGKRSPIEFEGHYRPPQPPDRGGCVTQASIKPRARIHPDRELIRRPHPDLLGVLDPRATSRLAARVLKTIGPTSMLIAETLAAGIHFQSDLYFGDSQNAMGAWVSTPQPWA